MPPQAGPPIDLTQQSLSRPAPAPAGAPLRVLDITEWFGETSGGVRRYLLEKARYVSRREGLSHVVVVPGPRTSVTRSAGVRWYRLKGPVIPRQAPYRALYRARAIRRIVAREQPDLIEVGSPWLAPWIARGAARRAGIPAVWFFHGNFPAGLDRPATDAAWWYVRRVASGFARIVVSSESTGRDLERAGVERVTRIPLGVDLDTFHPRRRLAVDATRAAFGLPPAPAPVVAFVGRLVAEKELDLLATAWPAIARETGATLLLVGSGPREATLRQQLERLDAPRVLWRPFESSRDQMANLLAAVDLCVAPGSTETFGLAPLEALASGTPVVSADSGGVAEQVLRSGAGALFGSGNAEELGRVVVATLGRARDGTLGQLGRAYAEREHGWDMVFDRLFAMYREVLSERIAA